MSERKNAAHAPTPSRIGAKKNEWHPKKTDGRILIYLLGIHAQAYTEEEHAEQKESSQDHAETYDAYRNSDARMAHSSAAICQFRP